MQRHGAGGLGSREPRRPGAATGRATRRVPSSSALAAMLDRHPVHEPANGYGVQFPEAPALGSEAYQPGDRLAVRVGDGRVPRRSLAGLATRPEEQRGSRRRTGDRSEAEQVLAGCRPVEDDPMATAACRASGTAGWRSRRDRCGCAATTRDGWLEQSELLTGRDASDAIAALDAAPANGVPAVPQLAATFVLVTGCPVSGAGRSRLLCQGLSWGGQAPCTHRRRPALGALARLERPGPRRHHLRAASLEVVGDDQGVGVGPGRDV